MIIFLQGYDDGKWNAQCKKTLDKYIGNSNYDCGHLLMGLNTGGNAGCIGCVCDSEKKGTAVTGYAEVSGDPFVVDFWAHEIGHQFGASHTFAYTDEGSGTQMEPGSGSTIMGYAGTTGATDVQPNSDDYFMPSAYSRLPITSKALMANPDQRCSLPAIIRPLPMPVPIILFPHLRRLPLPVKLPMPMQRIC
jgi:hypothetical protein